jgi:hypothetical protein
MKIKYKCSCGVIFNYKEGIASCTDEPLQEIEVPEIEDKIKDYLDNQGVVLWGQFFDIRSKEGYRMAREFILDLLIDLGFTNEMVE